MALFSWLRGKLLPDKSANRTRQLEQDIGYTFRNRALLTQALTHRSLTDLPHENLERLEFLGDAILEQIVSVHLFNQNPTASEGELTMRRSALVNKEFLADAGEAIGLHRYLLVESGVRLDDHKVRRNLVGDATESLIGALFLDGGLEATKRFIHSRIIDHSLLVAGIVNYKGQLIELCHQRGIGKPRFHLLQTRGPEHDKQFVVQVRVGQQTFMRAESDTKKAAEQAAAKMALTELN
ncbi:MAG: ribonuclease III [Candidatus Marinimicrobia bacterium]|nr:ribonuclease III [Candidatus Neomarinimicrobiota bacterium]